MTLAYERVARKSFGFQHAAPLYTVTDIGKLSLAPDVRGVATDDADIVEEGCLLHETGINSKSSPFRAFKSLTGHKHAVDCQYLFQPGSGCIISVNYLFDACHQSSSMISHHPWVSGASPYWMSCSAW